jgi:hypothetical protein
MQRSFIRAESTRLHESCQKALPKLIYPANLIANRSRSSPISVDRLFDFPKYSFSGVYHELVEPHLGFPGPTNVSLCFMRTLPVCYLVLQCVSTSLDPSVQQRQRFDGFYIRANRRPRSASRESSLKTDINATHCPWVPYAQLRRR